MAERKSSESNKAVERTVLCLAGSVAKSQESALVAHLHSRYSLSVRQRTEKILSTVDSRFLSTSYVSLLSQQLEQQQHFQEHQLNEGKVGDEEKKEDKDDKKDVHEEKEAEIREERREKEREFLARSMERVICPQGQVDNECVAIVLLGDHAIEKVESALKNDEEFLSLAGISIDHTSLSLPLPLPSVESTSNNESPRKSPRKAPKATEKKDSQKNSKRQLEAPKEDPAVEEVDPLAEFEKQCEKSKTKWNLIAPFNSESAAFLLDFFFSPPSLASLGELLSHEEEDRLSRSNCKWQRREPVEKRDSLNLEELLDFMFPKNQQHPWSTGRMLVYGEFGPLDTAGKLRSGLKGQHAVNKHEIEALVKEIDSTDLLYIYVGEDVHVLSQDEKIEVIKQADQRLRNDKQLSKEGAIALFERLPKDDQGRLSFHDVQKTIFKFREERIMRWKQIATNSVRIKKKPSRADVERRQKHERALAKASEEVLRPPPSIDDKDAFLITTKLLNRHSFQICNLEDKNDPSLVQNVRILRPQAAAAVKHGAIPFKYVRK